MPLFATPALKPSAASACLHTLQKSEAFDCTKTSLHSIYSSCKASHSRGLEALHVMCVYVSFAAGEVVRLAIAISNTGDVRLSEVLVTVPNVFRSSLVCSIGSQPYQTAAPAALRPTEVLRCNASYTVQLSDLEEQGTHTATVSAGDAASDLYVSKDVIITSQWRPELAAVVTPAQCTSVPGKAGQCVLCCIGATGVNMRYPHTWHEIPTLHWHYTQIRGLQSC